MLTWMGHIGTNVGTRHLLGRIAIALGLLFFSSACSPSNGGVGILGIVRDESSNPIANAQVSIAGKAATAVTGADGKFTVNYPGNYQDQIVLNVQASGYANVSGRLLVDPNAVQGVPFVMRALDVNQTFNIPSSADAPPVLITTQHGEYTTLLRIVGNNLVLPSGAVATGQVNIAMTSWNPIETLASAPAPLQAPDPAGSAQPAQLRTRGMVDIVFTQQNQILQIAPNTTLDLTVTVPTQTQAEMRTPPAGGAALPTPYLFYADPNQGLWIQAGTPTYDPNAGTFHAALPHLTAWNLDVYFTPSQIANGGCAGGQVVNECGVPVPSQAMNVVGLGYEPVSKIPITTDANGQYCLNLGTRTYAPEQFYYFVADAADPNNTSMPQFIPARDITACWDAPSEPIQCGPDCFGPTGCPADYQFGNCDLNTVQCALNPYATYAGLCLSYLNCTATAADGSTIDVPYATTLPCGFCGGVAPTGVTTCLSCNQNYQNCAIIAPNSQCGTIQTIVINDGHGKTEGQSCGAGDCCVPAPGGPALICSDQICVPAQ